MAPESHSKPISSKCKNGRPSTAGSSSSESKGRRSYTFLSALKRHSHSSSQQHSPSGSLPDNPTPSISPTSPILPEIKAVTSEGDESAFEVFHLTQADHETSRFPESPIISQTRATHGHMVPLNRVGFTQEQQSIPKLSSRGMPVPSLSLSLDYESQMRPMSTSDHKSPSLLSANSFSTSTSSGTYESAVSNEQPLISQAEDGSIEMATLGGLVEHLITDFSCKSICFRFYCLSYWTVFSLSGWKGPRI